MMIASKSPTCKLVSSLQVHQTLACPCANDKRQIHTHVHVAHCRSSCHWLVGSIQRSMVMAAYCSLLKNRLHRAPVFLTCSGCICRSRLPSDKPDTACSEPSSSSVAVWTEGREDRRGTCASRSDAGHGATTQNGGAPSTRSHPPVHHPCLHLH